MKKLLLSLALLLSISLTANAQSIKRPNPNRHRHYVEYAKPAPHRHVQQMPDYVGELRFHAMGSIAPGSIVQMFRRYNPDSFMVGGMFEYQAGRAVSLGIGGEFTAAIVTETAVTTPIWIIIPTQYLSTATCV